MDKNFLSYAIHGREKKKVGPFWLWMNLVHAPGKAGPNESATTFHKYLVIQNVNSKSLG